MLSPNELKMLSWLGENFDFGPDGFIADLGAFLGGSTRGFASGVASRPDRAANAQRIHSYDMFKVPDDDYSRGMIGMERPLGSSVVDLYLRHIQGYEDVVCYHAGDVRDSPVPAKSLDIAFVDIAKSRGLNSFVIDQFFSRLEPGRSILIQQDHNDHSCPWIAVSTEYLRDCFEYLTDEGSSRIFLNTHQIQPNAAKEIEALSLDDQCDLLDAAVARSKHENSAYQVLVSKAWLINDKSGPEDAVKFLSEIRSRQPWDGDFYADLVATAINYVADIGGMQVYLDRYFRG